MRSDAGELTVKVPRSRKGDFDPTLVPKHQRHFDGFDDIIVSLLIELPKLGHVIG